MKQERKELVESTAVEQLWEFTRPNNPHQATLYRELLHETVKIPKIDRFESPFLRPKKSTGSRKIVPAADPLRTVQYLMSRWIQNNLPQGEDYCYSGLGVKRALEAHEKNSYALVCDLKDAFDQVTEEKITNWFGFYKPELKGKPLDLMVDLLTFEGKAPQGCVSSAYAYNVVVAEMDRHLGIIAPQLGVTNWTRYSDNLCFSAKNKFDFEALEAQVKRVATGFGFNLSWTKSYSENIEYLGAQISDGIIRISDDKAGEFMDKIYQMLESQSPELHYRRVLGILNWAKHISGPHVQEQLLTVLDTYFRKVNKPTTVPKTMGTAYGRMI